MEKYTIISKYFAVVLLLLGTVSLAHGQHSMYQDNEARQVGDILTVILQENISGSTSSDAQNSSSSAAGAGGSVAGNFMPFQPTFGSDVEVNYDSDEQVQTNQGQLLEGYMSVEVTGLTDSGNLIVEGTRSTEINGEKHQIDLKGIVRPKDIDGRNQILSYRLGNAEINYEKDGDIKGLMKKEGFFKRAAMTIVGAGIAAVAVFKAVK